MKYAECVAAGTIKTSRLFGGIVEAFISGETYKSAGQRLTGMRYGPDMRVLAHAVYAQSPAAYQELRNVVQLPHPRTLQ